VPNSHAMDFGDEQDSYAQRLLEVLGTNACRELLDALKRSDGERASLIGRLCKREGASWLADLLIEIESDPDDITRIRLVDALQRGLSQPV
jgi:hypothetical protein